MKKIGLSIIATALLAGCGSTTQPRLGSHAKNEDKTLNNNTVDLLTLIRVQNNYGIQHYVTESNIRDMK